MTIPKRRCQHCHCWFEPDKRKVDIQMTCLDPDCQRRRQYETSQAWWKRTPVRYRDRRIKIRDWDKQRSYSSGYRSSHPQYAEREAQRMRRKRERSKTVARQISITRIPVGELWRSLGMGPVSVARQISMDPFFIGRRWGGLGVERFVWAPSVARQISITGLRW